MEINIESQRQGFASFLQHRHNTLLEFATLLGFSEPQQFVKTPARYLQALSNWLAKQEIKPEQKVWLATRVGYFLGEYFNLEYQGEWQLCEDIDSSLYCHYIVTNFTAAPNPEARFSPMSAAIQLTDMPVDRSLTDIVKLINNGLQTQAETPAETESEKPLENLQ